MKLIKHDSIREHKALNKQYEYILHEYEFKYHFVSVFDGWVCREDFDKLLVNVGKEEQQKRNTVMHAFSMSLANEYKLLNFNCDYSNNELFFKRFESINDINQHMGIQPTDGNFEFNILIPELDAWYISGDEDTHSFVLKDPSKIEVLSNLARKHGLFLFSGT